MSGGPAKKPKYPAEATAAIPLPKPLSLWRAAAEKISGTQFANPTPTKPKPATEIRKFLPRQASVNPAAPTIVPAKKTGSLSNRATQKSPHNRIDAISKEKEAYPMLAAARPTLSSVLRNTP